MEKAKYRSQALLNLPAKPLLIVLSGPSGVGKDAVLDGLKKTGYHLEYITTVTTRSQRAKERNNVDYHFVSTEKFQEMTKHEELLEWAKVYGNWYGIPRQPVKQALDQGRDTVVKVDVQGAATIKKILPQAVFIFLVPPSIEELAERLEQRQTESSSDFNLRLKTAEKELKQLPLFDYIVFNKRDEIGLAISHVDAIITAEKCRVTPRDVAL